MRRNALLGCTILASILLTPVSSFCTSIALEPASADVVRSGKTVVVAYEDKAGVQVQANNVNDGSICWHTRISAKYLVNGLCESHGLVYIPTGDEGVFVLNTGTGSTTARLRPRKSVSEPLPVRNPAPGFLRTSVEPLVACTGNRVLVAYSWENWLVAYDTLNFRPVWKHILRDHKIHEVYAKGNEFTVLALVQSRWKQIVLQSDNGKVVASRPSTEPGYVIPESLPNAVKEWFLKTVGGRFGLGGRFTFEHGVDMWFIGVPADLDSTGTIYAVGDNGDVAWKKRVPGLSAAVLSGDHLVAVTRRDNRNEGDPFGKLFALDITGRQLWNVDLDHLSD